MRSRLGLTVRDVEHSSRLIAKKLDDPRYILAKSVISNIENHNKVPGIFKTVSLSLIYGCSIQEILYIFGFDAYKENDYSDCVKSNPGTHPVDFLGQNRLFNIPLRFDPAFSNQNTLLLNRVIQEWDIVPLEFFNTMDFKTFLYFHIGKEDNIMYPMLQPHSIVKVDTRLTQVLPGPWKNEYERPLYMISSQDGYRCGWCMLEGGDIILLPHSLSQMPHERYRLGKEGSVMGQVVAFWRPLTP